MKSRIGFVGNSSSSNFVVAFLNRPRTREALRKMMFPDKDNDGHVTYYDYCHHVGEIVDQVFKDLKGQRCMTEAQVTEEFRGGWHEFELYADPLDIQKLRDIEREEDSYNREYWHKYHAIRDRLGIKPMDDLPERTEENGKLLDEFEAHRNSRDFNKFWERKDKLRDKMAKQSAKKFMEKNGEKFIARFSYSDNDGSFYSLMEHGEIFENIEHVRISHH